MRGGPTTQPHIHVLVAVSYCCTKAYCALALLKMRGENRDIQHDMACPYLFFNGTQYRCPFAEEHKESLSIGAGCCSSLNTERRKMATKLKKLGRL